MDIPRTLSSVLCLGRWRNSDAGRRDGEKQLPPGQLSGGGPSQASADCRLLVSRGLERRQQSAEVRNRAAAPVEVDESSGGGRR